MVYNKDLGDYSTGKSINGTRLDPNDIAYPCGLIAKYEFNDRYKLYKGTSTSGERIPIDETNIAHRIDRDFKFKNPTDLNINERLWKNIEDGKI